MKVYLIDVDQYEFDIEPITWDDEKFISESTIQNNVYSISEFEDMFNQEEINTDNFVLRFL